MLVSCYSVQVTINPVTITRANNQVTITHANFCAPNHLVGIQADKLHASIHNVLQSVYAHCRSRIKMIYKTRMQNKT